MNKLTKRFNKGLVATGFLGASMASQAAVDTAAAITAITEAATAVGIIGAAVLIVVVSVKAYKWIQRAL